MPALNELLHRAMRLGATAVVGVSILMLADPASAQLNATDLGSSVGATWDDNTSADETRQDESQQKRFSAKVGVGPIIGGIYAEPVYGVGVDMGFGAWIPARGIFAFGTLSYMRAETDGGLNIHRPAIGAMFEWDQGRWNLGIGPQINMMFIPRVSGGGSLISIGVGMDALVSYDLYEGESGDAVFLGLVGNTSLQFPAAGPHYGAALRLGYRL